MGRSQVKSKVITFNLYVAKRHVPHYFDVFIHPDHKALQKERQKFEKKSGECAAFFRPDTLQETVKIDKDGTEHHIANVHLGQLHFARTKLTFNLIVHELHHAICHWNSTVAHNIHVKEDEERSAEAMGSLFSEFLDGIDKHLNGRISSYDIKLNKKWFRK